jgi:hypothetical protein
MMPYVLLPLLLVLLVLPSASGTSAGTTVGAVASAFKCSFGPCSVPCKPCGSFHPGTTFCPTNPDKDQCAHNDPPPHGEIRMDASDPRIAWAGRTVKPAGGGVQFDWLGVQARLTVTGASYLSATISTTATRRGTRLKAYVSDSGFMYYPEVQFWVRGENGTNSTQEHDLWLGDNINEGISQHHGSGPIVVTLENLVAPQCECLALLHSPFSTLLAGLALIG